MGGLYPPYEHLIRRRRSDARRAPYGLSFLIAHQEVLVIDACEMKVQFASVYAAGPDQTRMGERSISDHDGQAVEPVVHNVVISHLADRIGAALSA